MARITLTTHWKFQRLARAVGSKVLARGILETLWEPCWVAGDAYLGTSQDIEAICEWKGPAGALTKALLMEDGKSAGFIEPYVGRLRDGASHYQVHDFHQHCPQWVNQRRRVQKKVEAALPRTCEFCRQEYLGSRATSAYCSHKCRSSAYRRDANLSVTVASRELASRDDDSGAEAPRDVTLTHSVTLASRELASREAVSADSGAVSDAPFQGARDAKDPGISVTKSPPAPIESANSGLKPPVTLRNVTLIAKDVTYAVPRIYVSTPCSTPIHLSPEPNRDTDPATDPAPPIEASPSEPSLSSEVDSEGEAAEEEVEGLEPPAPRKKPVAGRKPKKRPRKPATPRSPISPHPPLSVVLTFPVTGEGGPWWYLIEDQVAVWQTLYPALDILSESRQCLAWIQANPTRKKTYRGMAQCLVHWFNNSVDRPRGRGPTMVTGSLRTAGNRAALEEFVRRRQHGVES